MSQLSQSNQLVSETSIRWTNGAPVSGWHRMNRPEATQQLAQGRHYDENVTRQ